MLIAGVILVITIPFWLTPVEQGFFFFFYSIISLQVMCELGLNQIIMQRLSACYSNLSIDEDNLLSGLPEDIGDFHTILTAAKTWYRNIAIFFLYRRSFCWKLYTEKFLGPECYRADCYFSFVINDCSYKFISFHTTYCKTGNLSSR